MPYFNNMLLCLSMLVTIELLEQCVTSVLDMVHRVKIIALKRYNTHNHRDIQKCVEMCFYYIICLHVQFNLIINKMTGEKKNQLHLQQTYNIIYSFTHHITYIFSLLLLF